jgi:uncharacterized coiled-coil DUF342 family protein
MFGSKNLDELVKGFVEKYNSRVSKIEAKLRDLESGSQRFNAKIKELTGQLVQFEMDDDAAGADKCRKEIRRLRLELSDNEDLASGYREQLYSAAGSFLEKDVDKIKAAAVKSEEERKERQQAIREEVEELKRQKRELDNKIDRLVNESTRSSDYLTIQTIKPVVQIAEQKFSKLDYSKQEAYIRKWMLGGDVEQFFRAPAPYNGPNITYGQQEESPYRPRSANAPHIVEIVD